MRSAASNFSVVAEFESRDLSSALAKPESGVDLQVALSSQTLCRLIRENQIKVSEIRCLDGSTKYQIRKCLLNSLISAD